MQDAGLLEPLLAAYRARSGCSVKAVAVGTGEALAMAQRGDADVVLAHAPELERAAVELGVLVARRPLMANRFLIVGPAEDPAGIAGVGDAAEALRRVAASGVPFVSRGDGSGTHVRERSLWAAAGVDPAGVLVESGQGMGATLMIAGERRGYTLTDRATYLAFADRVGLEALVTSDPRFDNLYSVSEVSTARGAAQRAAARRLAEFLAGAEAAALIDGFGADRYGESLFAPAAAPAGG